MNWIYQSTAIAISKGPKETAGTKSRIRERDGRIVVQQIGKTYGWNGVDSYRCRIRSAAAGIGCGEYNGINTCGVVYDSWIYLCRS